MKEPFRIGIAAGLAGLALAGCGRPASRAEASGSPAAEVVADRCSEDHARGAYMAAHASGLVTGEDVAKGEGVVILVNLRHWRAIGFEGQKDLAAVVDCMIGGPGAHVTAMRFREDRSGPDLWSVDGGELLRLRAQGYGQAGTPT